MAKREKTKHKGIYKVGDVYYITYYVGPKKCEKAVGRKLEDALSEKVEREKSAKSGKYVLLEKQEATTFDDLLKIYKEDKEAKEYILNREQTYLDFFKGKKLSHITRSDLFAFRDKLKETSKIHGGKWSYTFRCAKCKTVFQAEVINAKCPKCSKEGGHYHLKEERQFVEVTDGHVNRVMAGLRRLFSFATNREMMQDTPFPKATKSGLFYPEQRALEITFLKSKWKGLSMPPLSG